MKQTRKKWPLLIVAALLMVLAVFLFSSRSAGDGDKEAESYAAVSRTQPEPSETAAAVVLTTEPETEETIMLLESESETVWEQQETEADSLEETENAEETEPVEETQPYVSPIDFEALASENPDVIAWIHVDDTRIDYPVYHSDDNEYYLHHDPLGNVTTAGSIFLDCDSSGDFVSRNNILYGHHMKNGSMFKDLMKFRSASFLESHPYFTIYTPQREIRLKAVACYYVENNYEIRRNSFSGQADFDEYVEESVSRCSFAGEVDYPVKSLYTLVTCSYEINDARTILLAVEVDEEGKQLQPDEAFLEEIARSERAVLIRDVGKQWRKSAGLLSVPEIR